MVELTKRKINPLVKIFLITVFLMISCMGKAQNLNERIFVGPSYTHFNQSLGEISARYLVKKDGGLLLGANVLLGTANRKLLLIPELNATQYFWGNNKSSAIPFARLNTSSKTITPQIGIGVLFVEISAGYGFSISDSQHYKTKGFRASLNINIPLEWHMKLF